MFYDSVTRLCKKAINKENGSPSTRKMVKVKLWLFGKIVYCKSVFLGKLYFLHNMHSLLYFHCCNKPKLIFCQPIYTNPSRQLLLDVFGSLWTECDLLSVSCHMIGLFIQLFSLCHTERENNSVCVRVCIAIELIRHLWWNIAVANTFMFVLTLFTQSLV